MINSRLAKISLLLLLTGLLIFPAACSNQITVAGTPPHHPFLAQFGSPGTGAGQFLAPSGIAVDDAGYVYVVDASNDNVQKFSASGTYLTQWGGLGSGNGQFNFPNALWVDHSGNIYVADTHNFRVQKFTSDGTYLSQWGGVTRTDNSGIPMGLRLIPWATFMYWTYIGKMSKNLIPRGIIY